MTDAAARWADIGPLEQLKQLGGLAFLQNVVNGTYPEPPIAATLGFRFVEVESGRAVVALTPHTGHYNLIQTVHGGVHATLLDTAMACAILSRLPTGQGFTTLELKINYVRPMTAATGEVCAEGRIINVGRTIALSEGRLTDSEGRLIAHGTTTCLVLALQ
ncbi:MAG: PaaI family thioesterase [Burkholderiales bacterium]|nr:PaaI family thioesterase [Burkholderiales bacterium]